MLPANRAPCASAQSIGRGLTVSSTLPPLPMPPLLVSTTPLSTTNSVARPTLAASPSRNSPILTRCAPSRPGSLLPPKNPTNRHSSLPHFPHRLAHLSFRWHTSLPARRKVLSHET